MSRETIDLRRLERALAMLDERTRNVFMMSAAEGLSYAEIAERLGISPESVERHLADALHALIRRMERWERPWWRFWR
ncbi:sigma-70 family RNA polymerase sigma factor [Sphingosinicella sp. CPCC 101087]|uniref:sigma-70 family RNA polymerase sigma factor n=1 Tax=Sphingosinicella sp. CPCC 101087 TaxID=2497754 RepID=UPI00101BB7D7|nr:sigma-70 family RNA polymerase sigma factor [Sphingosinicella sp. CPCC 101087]